MAGFLSNKAQKSTRGNRSNSFTLEEDKIIAQGLSDGKSAPQIEELLKVAGCRRTINSVRYRIGVLRKMNKEFDSLEEMHGQESGSTAVPAPVEKKVEESNEEVDEPEEAKGEGADEEPVAEVEEVSTAQEVSDVGIDDEVDEAPAAQEAGNTDIDDEDFDDDDEDFDDEDFEEEDDDDDDDDDFDDFDDDLD